MIERSANDLGVTVPEREGRTKKKKSRKVGNDEDNPDISRSFRRFMDAKQKSERSSMDGPSVDRPELSPEERFAAARKTIQTNRVKTKGMTTSGEERANQSGTRAHQDTGARNKQEQQQQQQQQQRYLQRTNRQVKRRAFEKKKRKRRREKRLGIEMAEEDLEDIDDDIEPSVNRGLTTTKSMGRRVRDDGDEYLPSFLRVNNAPPSIKRKQITDESVAKNMSSIMRRKTDKMKKR